MKWRGWMYGLTQSVVGGVPISDVVRCLIDDAYEDIVRVRRKQAIERLIALNVEDPPDPETLSRELEAAHEPGSLH